MKAGKTSESHSSLLKTALYLTALLSVTLLPQASAVDCFGWSVTKRVNFMEMLPMLLYYDQINWINLDPSRTCTFRTTEALFMKLYTSDLVVSYQPYSEKNFKCTLQTTPAVAYKNLTWMYANHVLAPTPETCGYLVTI